MKLQLAEIVKILNVEHRTSNIEHRMMMTLRFIDLKLNETYRNLQPTGNLSAASVKPKSYSEPNFMRQVHFDR